MKKRVLSKYYSCFVYGEGKRDKDFLKSLIDLKKFKDHTSRWVFNYDNACGNSAHTILEKCRKLVNGSGYDLVLCFIDLDDLKHKFPETWRKEKLNLEEKYENLSIVWQENNAEEEYKKVLGDMNVGKGRINKLARERIEKFINSDFWNRILTVIKNKEKELEAKP